MHYKIFAMKRAKLDMTDAKLSIDLLLIVMQTIIYM